MIFFVQQCSVLQNDSALPNMGYKTVVRKSNVSITEDRIVEIRDGPLFFYWGGGVYHFSDLQTIFLKSNAFQTIFSLHFVMKTIFLQPFLKTLQAFYRSYLKKHFLCIHTHEKSHLNETNQP